MTNTWDAKKLGEVCSFLNRGVSPKYVDSGGILVLNQRCVRDHRIDFTFSKRHNVSVKMVAENRLLRSGDVLVNSTGTGTLGRVAQLEIDPPEPTTVDSHVTIVRPLAGLFFQKFFNYMLQGIEEEIQKSGEGCGGQTELSRSVLAERFVVRFPTSLAEQRRIVGILDEAFEGIATAKANAEKNVQNSRAIFQSYLQRIFAECENIGKLKTLREIATNFGRGKSRHRPRDAKHLYGGKYPFVQTGDIRNAEHVVNEYSQTYSEAGLAQSKLWPEGTICITIAANIAETAILGFDACFPDSVIGLVADPDKADIGYIEYLLQAYKVRLQAMGKGSAQANINMATFENQRFPFPPVEDQLTIVTKLDSLSNQTQCLIGISEEKIAALDALRASLLHKAFTGEL